MQRFNRGESGEAKALHWQSQRLEQLFLSAKKLTLFRGRGEFNVLRRPEPLVRGKLCVVMCFARLPRLPGVLYYTSSTNQCGHFPVFLSFYYENLRRRHRSIWGVVGGRVGSVSAGSPQGHTYTRPFCYRERTEAMLCSRQPTRAEGTITYFLLPAPSFLPLTRLPETEIGEQ